MKSSKMSTGRNASKKVGNHCPKRLAQLFSVSHSLVPPFKKHRSKTSNQIRFGSLHFKDNWGWPWTAVRMWIICSNRKLYQKKRSFCSGTLHNHLFCHTS